MGKDDEVIRTTRDFTRVRGNATGPTGSWKIGCSLAGPVAVTLMKYGWESSKGTRLELEVALALGLDVIQEGAET